MKALSLCSSASSATASATASASASFRSTRKMLGCWRWLLLILTLIITMLSLEAVIVTNNNPHLIKTKTFLTPLFTLSAGSVTEKFYYNINFPQGHIAIKSFDVEVIDKSGNPISLFDTYLHHWAIVRYYQHINNTTQNPNTNVSFTQLQEPDFIIAGNNGVCQKHAFPQYYGTGADSRGTSTFLPDPYGIEVGNEDDVPLGGYEEKWCLNVHAIDTRGVEDRLGCVECRCDLYNVTEDGNGVALGEDYKGGLRCCYDGTQCKVSEGCEFGDDKERNLYVRYTVKWVDWDDDLVIPVKVYIFDVTDTWKPFTDTTEPPALDEEHNCLVEYNVESCSSTKNKGDDDECNATKMIRVIFPDSGYLIYGMAHLHIGGIGAMLYGEDGRVLCSSSPIYGKGSEVGNEEGYVVGMSTCYPQIGSVKINNKEMLTFVSKYDPTQNHIGVMGLFHIMVAHKLPNSLLHMEEPILQVAGETTM